ncbi:B-type flagellin [Posidoniimonas polymericola]|uniref:Flagellin n=1 Tax=Posidoniimonas polymericola TaxID=2528002 RepID=A0A5C5YEV6_9BACT|nr:flagellin [Posidoniimonas polymericola]TWT73469.1 B-type flagellin [Posidoniimonas polymericola]
MLSVRPSGVGYTALNNLNRSTNGLNNTTLKLATGLRINSAKDDPAGLIAAEQLRGDLVDIGARRRTIGYERSQLSVQQSGRQQATGVLHDLRGRVVEATGDSTSAEQKAAIQTEIDSALDGLDRIADTTGISFPAALEALRSGGEGNVVSGDPAAAAEAIDAELSRITQASAAAGAYEKYTLDVDQRIAEDQAVVTAQSLSEIADADYAEEASNLTRNEIILKTSLRTVGLLNQIKGEGILTLLGVK